MKYFLSSLVLLVLAFFIQVTFPSCANIIPPGGGPRDSLPPILSLALPRDSAINFNSNRITLTFNEYIEVKEIQTNLVVSPIPKNAPIIDYKLRNVTIKLKDTLEPSTTYSLQFGNSIKDINEGNVAKNFTYIFSTGKTIDDGSFSGKIVLSESGKLDTTLIVVLHKNLTDTAIYKNSPRYLAKQDGKGNFIFNNIAYGTYNAFVIPNEYSKKYDDSTKHFAFLDSAITISKQNVMATFYAFKENEKFESKPNSIATILPVKNTIKDDKRLRYTTSIEGGFQDLLTPFVSIDFNKKLKSVDSTKIVLCDTFFNPILGQRIEIDSNKRSIQIFTNWQESTPYKIVVNKSVALDTNNISLLKSDTIQFTTKSSVEYGSVAVRFLGLDITQNPVLQIVQGDKLVESVALSSKDFKRKLYKPGEYELRILMDKNKNEVYDAGNYKKKIQPEIVIQNEKWKLQVKAYWDNETSIQLP